MAKVEDPQNDINKQKILLGVCLLPNKIDNLGIMDN